MAISSPIAGFSMHNYTHKIQFCWPVIFGHCIKMEDHIKSYKVTKMSSTVITIKDFEKGRKRAFSSSLCSSTVLRHSADNLFHSNVYFLIILEWRRSWRLCRHTDISVLVIIAILLNCFTFLIPKVIVQKKSITDENTEKKPASYFIQIFQFIIIMSTMPEAKI